MVKKRKGESNLPWGLRTVDNYDKLEIVGEGTYGQVWKGENRTSGRMVALKKIRVDPYRKMAGLTLQTLREIKILNSFPHPNVVELIECVTSAKTAEAGVKSSLYLVFEYLNHDMGGLIDIKYDFTEEEIRCFFMQLVRAMKFLHKNRICHRDIKSSNLLISNKHELKLADFGLARQLFPDAKQVNEKYTNKVVTLWYRAPELLLGERQYDYSVDIWSAGCILLEMYTKVPVFQGRNEMDQLRRVFKLCGRPDKFDWPALSSHLASIFDTYCEQNEEESRKMNSYLEANQTSLESSELIKLCLKLSPSERPSADDIMLMDCIKTAKEPQDLPRLRVKQSLHEYSTKKMKKEDPNQVQHLQQLSKAK